MSRSTILLFAPYGLWTVHHRVDAVLGAALQQRGARVWAVGCDGIFDRCPIGGTPFDRNRCRRCRHSAEQIFAPFEVPVVWLGTVVDSTDVAQCRDWAQTLPVEGLPEAVFEEGFLGRWVSAGVMSRFTARSLDLEDPEVVATLRAFLCNAAVLQRALTRLLDRIAPDHMICYSGMHAYYRVAFELARRRGLPVLVHERGTVDDTFQFLSDHTTQMVEPRLQAWQQWKDVPLVPAELEWVRGYMHNREAGKNINWHAAYSYTSSAGEVHHRLRLPPDKPVVAVFPSNDWEYGMLRQHTRLATLSQIEGLRALFDSLPPERGSLVIRLHPPMGYSTLAYGTDFLREILALNRALPENVRVIMPGERMTSYALLWNAHGVVTFGSTVGLEALFKGARALSFARNIYTAAVPWVSSLTALPVAIGDLLANHESMGTAELRNAYRAAFFIFQRLNYRFTSFGIKGVHNFELRIRSKSELAPGIDPGLDRLASHILERQPLCPSPGPSERERSTREETQFIQEELTGIRQNRSAAAAASRRAAAERREPLVSALRIRRNGIRDPQDTFRRQSLRLSRHSSIELLPYTELAWPPSSGSGDCLRELCAGLDQAKGDYVHFGADNHQVDQSCFATAVDFLESAEGRAWDGLLAGAWICDATGKPVGEIFTAQSPGDCLEDALKLLPSLRDASQLIALMICRREAWQRLVDHLRSQPCQEADLARSIFRIALHSSGALSVRRCGVPLVCIHPQEDPAVALKLGIDCGRRGRWDHALGYFQKAWQSNPSGEELGFYRAAALARLGRLWEARILAEAERAGTPDSPALDGLIADITRAIGDGELRYDDVAASIKTVEGWLVDGQERFLFEKVKALPQGAAALEIGSCYGRSTAAMAYACWGNGKHIYAIDTFMGNVDGGTRRQGNSFFDLWEHNLRSKGLLRYVSALPGFSAEHLASWGHKPCLDFVFIDASHRYADIIRELELVYPLVKDGGWIAFHDVEPAWPGPWRVWRQSAAALLAEHEYCGTIACGRKMPGRVFTAPSPEAGFDYAGQWVEFLRPHLPELTAAMDATRALRSSAVGEQALQRAEAVVARMPDHPLVRRALREMLTLEAQIDPFLHYWNALTLLHENRKTEALPILEKAMGLSGAELRARLSSLMMQSGAGAAGVQRTAVADASRGVSMDGPLIVFVNTYYPRFLEALYRREPKLCASGYAEQLHALIRERFGDSDFYSHGMRQAGWQAEDLIINCPPLQAAWARENGVCGQGADLALEQIRRLKPQVVYLQDLSLASPAFLERLRPLTELVAGQIASPLPPQASLEGLDVIFSSFPHFVERFRAKGITARYQPLAFDARILEQIRDEVVGPRPYAVTFVGGISPAHGQGRDFLERLAERVDIDCWGYGAETLAADSSIRRRHRGEAWAMDMFRLLCRSRITVNRHIDVAENYANNMRLFEATGCGALLITDWKENLDELFTVGKEVVAYRSPEECAELIRYYLSHPDEAAAIARAGQERTLRDHSYAARMQHIAGILQRQLRYRRQAEHYPAPDRSQISTGYQVIAAEQITPELTAAWKNDAIPARQRALVQQELAAMYRGRAPEVYRVMAAALRPLVKPGSRVLEIGCASGYYHEVLEYLVNSRIAYTGVDYSEALIAMARDYYPGVEFHTADGAHLPFDDGSFEVAVSSCVLLHVPNYRDHIREAARVAARYVVAHRTPFCRQRPTQFMTKRAYGIETVELRFNETEFISAFTDMGLKLLKSFEYVSDPQRDRFEATYVFAKPGLTPADAASVGSSAVITQPAPWAQDMPEGLLRLLQSSRLDPCHPFFERLAAAPEKIGLGAEDLTGKTASQLRELIAGEVLARLAMDAGRAASTLLFKSQWGYQTPDWFDHRHHMLYPEMHCNDYWTASADNILKSLPLDGALLDLCAGDCFYDYHFYRKRAGRIVCVDINPAAYRQAMRLHRAENITYHLGNVLEYEPVENSFDVVAIRGAIEHFCERDQQAIFRKALRALKPGGWFCGDTVAGSQTHTKQLPAHDNEWADETAMRRELARVFAAVETSTRVSRDRTTLLWRCCKGASPVPAGRSD